MRAARPGSSDADDSIQSLTARAGTGRGAQVGSISKYLRAVSNNNKSSGLDTLPSHHHNDGTASAHWLTITDVSVPGVTTLYCSLQQCPPRLISRAGL